MQATREAILDAFLALAHTTNAVTVSIPAVAAEAGVSVRTVYRYFPSKDELQDAAAYRFTTEALDGVGRLDDTTVDDIEDHLTAMWSLFAQRIPALIAEHSTPAGRDLRSTRLPGSRELVRRQAGIDLSDDDVDLLVAVLSSSMFLELVDRMGHDPSHAAALATRLGRLVLADAASASPSTTDPTDTPDNESARNPS